MRFRGLISSLVVAAGLSVCAQSAAAAMVDEFSLPSNTGTRARAIGAGIDGSVWLPETGANRIAHISSSGAVDESLLIPSSAANAQYITQFPDTDGNLWFSETANNKIARLTPAGVITEFSLPTNGSQPTVIATDGDGNPWVYQSSGSGSTRRIIRVDRLTQAMTEYTIPASSFGGSPTISGLARGSDGDLWYTETAGRDVIRIETSAIGTGTTTRHPTGSSSLGQGIGQGPDGSIYASDGFNTLFRITAAGDLTSSAVTAGALRGITPGPDNAIWFTSLNLSDTVGRRSTESEAETDTQVTPAINRSFAGITTSSTQYIWAAPTNTATVVRITVPPRAVVIPQVSGDATAGTTLSGFEGMWQGTPALTYAYQWRRCDGDGAFCSDISGATSSSYTITTTDIGRRLRLRATATNGAGSVAANSDATAVVAGRVLTLTTSGSGAGTVTSSPAGVNCTGPCETGFPDGTVVTLTATPNASSTFTGWSGACSGSGSCVVTMDQARSVTAAFTPIQRNLTVTVNGSGTVTSAPVGVNCSATCTRGFDTGTVVRLGPTPAPGWAFSGWSGGCSGADACTVTMSAAAAVTATFVASPGPRLVDEYQLLFNTGTRGKTIGAGPDGSVWVPEPGANRIAHVSPAGQVDESLLIPSSAANAQYISQFPDPDGNLWFSETANNKIARLTAAGEITEVSLPTNGSQPTFITVAGDGNPWVYQSNGAGSTRRILRVDRMTFAVTEYSIPGAGPSTPPSVLSITTGADGDVWYSESVNREVIHVETSAVGTGTIVKYATGAANLGSGLGLGPDGNVYLSNSSATLYSITPSGTITSSPVTAGNVTGVTAGPDTAIWFTSSTLVNTIARRATDSAAENDTLVPTISANRNLTGITTATDGHVWAAPNNTSTVLRVTVPPHNSVAPVVSGSAIQGTTLSTTTGTWQGTGTASYAYQWQRCNSVGASCADIASATAPAYVPVAADVGGTLRSKVTATNGGGIASQQSAPTAVVTATPGPQTVTVAMHNPNPLFPNSLDVGRITSSPAGIDCGSASAVCSASFPYGTNVVLTEKPEPFFYFLTWVAPGPFGGPTDCVSTTPTTCTVVADAARSVVAEFAQSPNGTVATHLAGTGSGTIAATATGVIGTFDCTAGCSVPAASTVTLTVTPAVGSTFAGWSAGPCSGTAACTFTAPSGPDPITTDITATFTSAAQPDRTLTVVRGGNGGGTVSSTPAGIDCGTTCSATFTDSTVVTLTATPDSQSSFTGWTGDCSGSGTCTVTMSQARSVAATFAHVPQQYALSVTLAGDGSGTVASSPAGIFCGSNCSASFTEGQVVTLTPTPGAQSTFSGWTGPCSTAADVCIVTMSQARAVTATFDAVAAQQHTLTVVRTGDGTGTVTSTPAGISCGTTCSAAFADGATVTLTAGTADDNSVFAGWSGACSGTGNCVVTMSQARTVSAAFTRVAQPRNLTVVRGGTGAGSVTSAPAGIDCGADCSEDFTEGTVVTLTATPDAQSSFTGWSGACSGTSTCTVTMSQARSVAATFAHVVQSHTLSVTHDGTGDGTVTSDPAGISCGIDCSASFTEDQIVTLTAAPAPQSSFTGWTGACTGVGACVVPMSQARSVNATFTAVPQPRTLTVNAGGDGDGTVTSSPLGISCPSACSAPFTDGTTVTLSATPDGQSTFTGWSGAGCSGTGGCTVTMTQAQTVTATFAHVTQQYSLTVVRTGNGTGTISSSPTGIDCGATCSTTFAESTAVTLTASAGAESAFTGWSGAGCSGTGACTVTMSQARTVSAEFSRVAQTRSLTVARAGTGTGAVTSSPSGINCGTTCSASFAETATVTLTAAPAPGSAFGEWTGDCSGEQTTCVVTMSQARSVVARFDVDTSFAGLNVFVDGDGDGRVVSNPAGIDCTDECENDFPINTMVTLTATAAPGSTFTGWHGGGCSGTGTCMVTMNSGYNVYATFSPGAGPLLSVSTTSPDGGNGSITSDPAGIACGADGACETRFAPGQVVTLTAAANSSSVFTGWGGDCSGTGTCTVTMSQARNVWATFRGPQNLFVTASNGGGIFGGSYVGGTVTSNPAGITCGFGGTDCSKQLRFNSSVTLTATPQPDSYFSHWASSGFFGGPVPCADPESATCTLTMDAAQYVTAIFLPIPGTNVQVALDGDGVGGIVSNPAGIDCSSTTANCTSSFGPGTTVTFTATADSVSRFTGWTSGPCAGDTGPCTLTTPSGTTATTISLGANFDHVLQPPRLTVSFSGGADHGSITSTNPPLNCRSTCTTTDVTDGQQVTLKGTPEGEYYFSGFSGCPQGQSTCTVTIHESTLVDVAFLLPLRNPLLTVTLDGSGGTVTSVPERVQCPGTCSTAFFETGTQVTLVPHPDAGIVFNGWAGDCSGTGACTVTMTQARNVTAKFIPRPSYPLTVQINGALTPGEVQSTPAGIVCSPTCTGSFAQGTQVTLSATAPSGYVFAGWSGEGCSGTANCVVTMSQARIVTARFDPAPIVRVLRVTPQGIGRGRVISTPPGIDCPGSCQTSFADGTRVSLLATPDPGSTFERFVGGCQSTTTTCDFTMSSNLDVAYSFTGVPQITVTTDGTGQGAVVSSPAGISCPGTCRAQFPSGTRVTLTATPANGQSSFNGFSGDCSGFAQCTITVDKPYVANATFDLGTVTQLVSPTVSGTPKPGERLTCVTHSSVGPDIALSYVWEVALRTATSADDPSWAPIEGGTNAQYTIEDKYDGSQIRCRQIATNSHTSGSNVSAPLRVDTDQPRLSGQKPSVTGPLVVGNELTCEPSDWVHGPSFAYRWERAGVAIPGAASKAYTPGEADRRTTLTCVVTASNDIGSTVAASDPVTVVGAPPRAVSPPRISLSYARNVTLPLAACEPARFDEDYNSYAYTWFREGVALPAVEQTYQTTVADLGHRISCKVVSTNPAGASDPRESADQLIPLPTPSGAPQGNFYTAPEPSLANRYTPVNMLALSNQFVNAIDDVAKARLRAAVDTTKSVCSQLAKRDPLPQYQPKVFAALDSSQTCGVLLNEPQNVAITTTGAYWTHGDCIEFWTNVDFGQPPCQLLNVDVPRVDPKNPPQLDINEQHAVDAARPVQVLWDLDDNGTTDATCGPDAPIARTLFEQGVHNVRAVIVNADSAATGMFPVIRQQVRFALEPGHDGLAGLRPGQPIVCRTSIDPPPEKKLPCITEATVGKVHITDANLCPISLRSLTPEQDRALPDSVRATLLAVAQGQPVRRSAPYARQAVPNPTPTSAEMTAATMGNALTRISNFRAENLTATLKTRLSAISGLNLEKAQFALDQIYDIQGRFKVNGIDITPSGGVDGLIVPSDVGGAISDVKSMLVSVPSAKESLDGIPLGVEDLSRKVEDIKGQAQAQAQEFVSSNLDSVTKDLQQQAKNATGALAEQLKAALDRLDLGPFKIKGQVDLKLEDDHTVTLTAYAELPYLNMLPGGSPVTTKVTLRGDVNGNIQLEGVRLKVDTVFLGPLKLNDLDLEYSTRTGLNIVGQFLFPPSDFGVAVNPFKLGPKGEFQALGLSFLAGGAVPGIPVGPGVFITRLDGSFNAVTPELSAGATVSVGPSPGKGCATIGFRGDLTLHFAPPPWFVHAGVDLQVVCIPLIKVSFDADGTGLVSLGASIKQHIGPVHVEGGIGGQVRLPNWEVYADISGGIDYTPIEAGVHALVSNRGFAACGRLLLFAGGAAVSFPGGIPPLNFAALAANTHPFVGCDISGYSPFGKSYSFRQAGGATGRKFTVDGKHRGIVLDVIGAGGAPKVALRAPDGTTYDFTGYDQATQTHGAQIGPVFGSAVPEESRFVIMVPDPAAGEWTLTPSASSPAIADLRKAEILPKPKVTAKVGGIGSSRVLSYDVANIPGQEVRFFEESRRGQTLIATVKGGGKGTRRFTVSEAKGTHRRIEAKVVQDGLPRDVLVVARFQAPNPKVGKVSYLRVRRSGGRAVIAWGKAPNAARYDLEVHEGSGKRTLYSKHGRTRVLKLKGIAKGEGVWVRIRAISAGGYTGPSRTGRLAGSLRLGTRPKPVIAKREAARKKAAAKKAAAEKKPKKKR